MLISQSLYDLPHQEYYNAYPIQIYTCHTSHIVWKNPQAFNIGGTVKQEKEQKTQ